MAYPDPLEYKIQCAFETIRSAGRSHSSPELCSSIQEGACCAVGRLFHIEDALKQLQARLSRIEDALVSERAPLRHILIWPGSAPLSVCVTGPISADELKAAGLVVQSRTTVLDSVNALARSGWRFCGTCRVDALICGAEGRGVLMAKPMQEEIAAAAQR